MPRVAVVIPVRDRALMVREAIASVLAQSERDFALVVVDDGSRDGSAMAAADALASAQVPTRVLTQPAAGVAAARNAGAAAVDSAWIAFLDSDDLWLPHKLARQMSWLAAHPTYRIAQTDERWVEHGRHRNPRAWHRKDERLFDRAPHQRAPHQRAPHQSTLHQSSLHQRSLHRCLVSPSAVAIARPLWLECGGFDESFPLCEDYELWLRLTLREPVGLVPERLVVKRGGHAGQLSRSTWGLDRFRVAALAKLLTEEALAPAERAAALAVLDAKSRLLAAGAARRGRNDEAARYLALAAAVRAFAPPCPGGRAVVRAGDAAGGASA